MSVRHADLAAGRWKTMPFVLQMANVGSDVERALRKRASGEAESCRLAFERALELLDLTIGDERNLGRVGELARAREALADNLAGGNAYGTDDAFWKGYFGAFARAARRDS